MKLKFRNVMIVFICICLVCVGFKKVITIVYDCFDTTFLNNDHNWDQYSNNGHYEMYNYYSSFNQLSNKDVIQYVDNFYNIYDGLESLGYSMETCKKLMQTLSLDDFQFIINKKYTFQKIKDYLNIKGCIVKDIPKYLTSYQNKRHAILSISYPSIQSYNKNKRSYYIHDPYNISVLVKSGFEISPDYKPDDLRKVKIPIASDNEHYTLRNEAANAIEKMYIDGQDLGYHLALNSGYRSYDDQKDIYDEYVKKYGISSAKRLVALPGTSEHQLGLGMDITSQSVMNGTKRVFGDTDEYLWCKENAYKYGLILRYPQNKTDITGITNEPWHFRYVGKKIAKEIYEKNWTLEEYISTYGFTYDLSLIE